MVTAQRYLLHGPMTSSIYPATVDNLTELMTQARYYSAESGGVWSVRAHDKSTGTWQIYVFQDGRAL